MLKFNRLGAGVFSLFRSAGGGGMYIAPPPSSNFRTNRRGEERQAANEISQRGASNEVLKFSLKGGQRSGQYQVKG